MREIKAADITEAVSRLCMESNYYIDRSIRDAFINAKEQENDALSMDVLDKLIANLEVASNEQIPICQDTGMAVVFVEMGQDARVCGGSVTNAINDGVAKGYKEGFLRKSVVRDPVDRVNTADNTPAVIHYDVVEGDRIKITVAPKGFGSENMSALKMLKPSDGIKGVMAFVLETIKNAGPNPCPPIIVGVGVGGTMEKAAIIAKRALLRNIGEGNENPFWARVEMELLKIINDLGIGPGGFGGKTTALAVNINTFPTHIAGLPAAVNIGCHVTRHKDVVL